MKATNHVYLLISFIEELKDVAMVQNWIDGARKYDPENQRVQMNLDRQQIELDNRKAHIHEAMFEISSSN